MLAVSFIELYIFREMFVLIILGGGTSTNTQAGWAKIAEDMYPGYNGTRPKMQIWHGSADSTIAPQNYQEELKQWTGVFGVTMTASASKANTPEASYVSSTSYINRGRKDGTDISIAQTTSDYGPNVQGIYGQGVGHSVPSHLKVSEAWFSLP